jgi:hypothetical protein
MSITTEQTRYENLLAPGFPHQSDDTFTMASGNNLKRGTIVALFTGGGNVGKLTAWDSGGSNGAATPYGVLLADCDASSADQSCVIYVTGSFNVEGLIASASGDEPIDAKNLLIATGRIFIKQSVGTAEPGEYTGS